MLYFLSCSTAVRRHIWMFFFLLVFSNSPVSAIEISLEGYALSNTQSGLFVRSSPNDDAIVWFKENHQKRHVAKQWKNRVLNEIRMLGGVGSFFLGIKLSRLFFKKGHRFRKSNNGSRRTIVGLILFAVTLVVVVSLLAAGATGEGGFIWLFVIPAFALMWLIYLLGAKSKRAATSRT